MYYFNTEKLLQVLDFFVFHETQMHRSAFKGLKTLQKTLKAVYEDISLVKLQCTDNYV